MDPTSSTIIAVGFVVFGLIYMYGVLIGLNPSQAFGRRRATVKRLRDEEVQLIAAELADEAILAVRHGRASIKRYGAPTVEDLLYEVRKKVYGRHLIAPTDQVNDIQTIACEQFYGLATKKLQSNAPEDEAFRRNLEALGFRPCSFPK